MAGTSFFWQRVQAAQPEDSLFEFEKAADRRYYDAQMLRADPERWCGACYLLGYCVELCLKTAYLRLVGLQPTDPAWTEYERITQLHRRGVRHHDLQELARLLMAQRQARRLDIDPVFEGEISSWSAKAALHWSESLRYRGALPTSSEIDELDLAATWMMLHRQELEN